MQFEIAITVDPNQIGTSRIVWSGSTLIATTLVFYEWLFILYIRSNFLNTTLQIEVLYEPVHEISNNVVWATSKASDQPAHTRSLIRAFASRLSILLLIATDWTPFGVSKLKRRLQKLAQVYTCQNATLVEISCSGSIIISNFIGGFQMVMGKSSYY